MADLPAALTYGKVVGRLILAVADSGDAGRNPDAVAAVGTVAFTPKNANVKVTTAGAEATVVLQKITCTLDTDGYVLDPMGVAGVWLVTGVYTVTYNLADANIDAHDIEVLDTHTDVAPLDLTTAMPVGTVLTASQYAELSSRVDALEAAPPGSAPDATTTSKGIVQLAGDLGGTAAAPTVPGLAGKAATVHTHTASQVSDSTTTGRALLTAVDAAAARAAIGAGTSSLALGTTGTTAAAGNDSRLSDSRTPSGTAGGDLSGTYPNPSVAKVGGVAVTGTPTSGQVITATSGTAASWATPSGGGGGGYFGYQQLAPSSAMRMYDANRVDTNSFNTLNRLTLAPVYVAWTGNLLRHFYINVGTAAGAGGIARLGIYQADSSGGQSPTLVAELGTVVTTSTGDVVLSKSAGSEITLPATGLYYLGAVLQVSAATVARYVSPATFGSGIFGESASVTAGTINTIPYVDGVTGALPANPTISGITNVGIYMAARVQ